MPKPFYTVLNSLIVILFIFLTLCGPSGWGLILAILGAAIGLALIRISLFAMFAGPHTKAAILAKYRSGDISQDWRVKWGMRYNPRKNRIEPVNGYLTPEGERRYRE